MGYALTNSHAPKFWPAGAVEHLAEQPSSPSSTPIGQVLAVEEDGDDAEAEAWAEEQEAAIAEEEERQREEAAAKRQRKADRKRKRASADAAATAAATGPTAGAPGDEEDDRPLSWRAPAPRDTSKVKAFFAASARGPPPLPALPASAEKEKQTDGRHPPATGRSPGTRAVKA